MRPDRHKKLWNCRPAMRQIRALRCRQHAPRLPHADMCRRRDVLGEAQRWICALCGQPILGKKKGNSQDHVIPRDLGGRDALGNLVLCHVPCNVAKANDIPTGCELVWLMFVNARLGIQPQVY